MKKAKLKAYFTIFKLYMNYLIVFVELKLFRSLFCILFESQIQRFLYVVAYGFCGGDG